MINPEEVFDAVRRGYDALEGASTDEIIEHFSAVDLGSVAGHVGHIKGILFEQEYVDLLEVQGVQASIFDATNHPVTDIAIWDNGEVINELQLKATDSFSYVSASIQEDPEVGFVVTSEVFSDAEHLGVIDSGIENEALEDAVTGTLFDEAVNPVSPISVVGWLIGLPF